MTSSEILSIYNIKTKKTLELKKITVNNKTGYKILDINKFNINFYIDESQSSTNTDIIYLREIMIKDVTRIKLNQFLLNDDINMSNVKMVLYQNNDIIIYFGNVNDYHSIISSTEYNTYIKNNKDEKTKEIYSIIPVPNNVIIDNENNNKKIILNIDSNYDVNLKYKVYCFNKNTNIFEEDTIIGNGLYSHQKYFTLSSIKTNNSYMFNINGLYHLAKENNLISYNYDFKIKFFEHNHEDTRYSYCSLNLLKYIAKGEEIEISKNGVVIGYYKKNEYDTNTSIYNYTSYSTTTVLLPNNKIELIGNVIPENSINKKVQWNITYTGESPALNNQINQNKIILTAKETLMTMDDTDKFVEYTYNSVYCYMVSDNKKYAYINIGVKNIYKKLEEIYLDKENILIEANPNFEYKLNANLIPYNATDKRINWKVVDINNNDIQYNKYSSYFTINYNQNESTLSIKPTTNNINKDMYLIAYSFTYNIQSNKCKIMNNHVNIELPKEIEYYGYILNTTNETDAQIITDSPCYVTSSDVVTFVFGVNPKTSTIGVNFTYNEIKNEKPINNVFENALNIGQNRYQIKISDNIVTDKIQNILSHTILYKLTCKSNENDDIYKSINFYVVPSCKTNFVLKFTDSYQKVNQDTIYRIMFSQEQIDEPDSIVRFDNVFFIDPDITGLNVEVSYGNIDYGDNFEIKIEGKGDVSIHIKPAILNSGVYNNEEGINVSIIVNGTYLNVKIMVEEIVLNGILLKYNDNTIQNNDVLICNPNSEHTLIVSPDPPQAKINDLQYKTDNGNYIDLNIENNNKLFIKIKENNTGKNENVKLTLISDNNKEREFNICLKYLGISSIEEIKICKDQFTKYSDFDNKYNVEYMVEGTPYYFNIKIKLDISLSETQLNNIIGRLNIDDNGENSNNLMFTNSSFEYLFFENGEKNSYICSIPFIISRGVNYSDKVKIYNNICLSTVITDNDNQPIENGKIYNGQIDYINSNKKEIGLDNLKVISSYYGQIEYNINNKNIEEKDRSYLYYDLNSKDYTGGLITDANVHLYNVYDYNNNKIDKYLQLTYNDLQSFITHNYIPSDVELLKSNDDKIKIKIKNTNNTTSSTLLYKFGLISDVHYEDGSDDPDDNPNYINKYKGVNTDEFTLDLKNALKFFNDENVNFICACGDITTDNIIHLDNFFDMYNNTNINRNKIPIFTCQGNHDCKALYRYNTDDSIINANINMWKEMLGYGSDIKKYYAYKEEDTTIDNKETSFYIEYDDDIFIFLDLYYKNGDSSAEPGPETYYYRPKTLKWFAKKLEHFEKENKRCFVFTHLFFKHKAGNGKEYYHYNNDRTNIYQYYGDRTLYYNLSYSQFNELNDLNNTYTNSIWFTGHSHYSWKTQQLDPLINVCNNEYAYTIEKGNGIKSENININLNDVKYKQCAYNIHVPSLVGPVGLTGIYPRKGNWSEGAIVEVYNDHIDINGIIFKEDDDSPKSMAENVLALKLNTIINENNILLPENEKIIDIDLSEYIIKNDLIDTKIKIDLNINNIGLIYNNSFITDYNTIIKNLNDNGKIGFYNDPSYSLDDIDVNENTNTLKFRIPSISEISEISELNIGNNEELRLFIKDDNYIKIIYYSDNYVNKYYLPAQYRIYMRNMSK